MAKVKTGIGKTKRDLRRRIGKLAKFVATEKGEFSTGRQGCLQEGSRQHGSGRIKLVLEGSDCNQPEMSCPSATTGALAPVAERPAAPVDVTRPLNQRGREWQARPVRDLAFRRSPHVVTFWQGGEHLIFNYATGVVVRGTSFGHRGARRSRQMEDVGQPLEEPVARGATAAPAAGQPDGSPHVRHALTTSRATSTSS